MVVAYNAATTLSSVLDRIPPDVRGRVSSVVVCDDASSDGTDTVSRQYQLETDLPLTLIRNPRNLGYGGNQKAAFRWAIANEIDIVVLLRGNGQYAPEVMASLVRPLELGAADAVFGSRMIDPGSALIGGMPLYKYVGNRLLSRFANAATGLELSEWHCGYRAYRVDALRAVRFDECSDGYDFDTELVLRVHGAGKTISDDDQQRPAAHGHLPAAAGHDRRRAVRAGRALVAARLRRARPAPAEEARPGPLAPGLLAPVVGERVGDRRVDDVLRLVEEGGDSLPRHVRLVLDRRLDEASVLPAGVREPPLVARAPVRAAPRRLRREVEHAEACDLAGRVRPALEVLAFLAHRHLGGAPRRRG